MERRTRRRILGDKFDVNVTSTQTRVRKAKTKGNKHEASSSQIISLMEDNLFQRITVHHTQKTEKSVTNPFVDSTGVFDVNCCMSLFDERLLSPENFFSSEHKLHSVPLDELLQTIEFNEISLADDSELSNFLTCLVSVSSDIITCDFITASVLNSGHNVPFELFLNIVWNWGFNPKQFMVPFKVYFPNTSSGTGVFPKVHNVKYVFDLMDHSLDSYDDNQIVELARICSLFSLLPIIVKRYTVPILSKCLKIMNSRVPNKIQTLSEIYDLSNLDASSAIALCLNFPPTELGRRCSRKLSYNFLHQASEMTPVNEDDVTPPMLVRLIRKTIRTCKSSDSKYPSLLVQLIDSLVRDIALRIDRECFELFIADIEDILESWNEGGLFVTVLITQTVRTWKVLIHDV